MIFFSPISSKIKFNSALVSLFLFTLLSLGSCKREFALESSKSGQSAGSVNDVFMASANDVSTISPSGYLITERWSNIPGNDVRNIPLEQEPSIKGSINTTEIAVDQEKNYGERIRGFITAPETGNYIFWIAGDDAAELWLSTGSDPANKKKIASSLSWTNYRDWTKFPSQRSVPIRLESNSPYYIEILHKQGGGGDNLSVRWTLPNGAMEEPVPGSRLSATLAKDEETGHLSHDQWLNIQGNDILDIPLQATPNFTGDITSLEGKTNYGSNYGERMRGYLHPPISGNYTFWVAGDDAIELWLSSNKDPIQKVKIAYSLSWTNPQEWGKFNTQRSGQITLQKENQYYIEALHKQGGGGDNLSVQWMLPDRTMETPIPGHRFSPFVGSTASDDDYTASDVINKEGEHDLTISGRSINGGRLAAITLINCTNIHITQNKLHSSTQVGIYLLNCKNITIDDNYFTNVSTGVYAEQVKDGGIVVNNNEFLNMRGPFPRGQFVQFNNVNGSNNSISYNKGENIFGQSHPEDAISLYQSNGTSQSPIKIIGNWIRGGGPSLSGGGIMLGDNGGSYLYAADNILVDPGQHGMAIAGGDHNVIVNNSIFAKAQYFTNVGIYVNPINGRNITNATVAGNRVNYYNSTNYNNNAWLSPNANKPVGWDGNQWGAAIGPGILPAVILNKH